jgi:hypothetical protein
MTHTQKVNALLQVIQTALPSKDQQRGVVQMLLDELRSLFDVRFYSPPPHFAGRVRILFVCYPLQQHIDVVIMEAARSLPSLFFYVTHAQGQWEGYGYVHYIQKVESWSEERILRWTLAVAQRLGCRELHLHDRATFLCEPRRSAAHARTQDVQFPIFLSLVEYLEKGQSWLESMGFYPCSQQKSRITPYYLPWKRETRRSTAVSTAKKAVRELERVPAQTLSDPLRSLVLREGAFTYLPEIATVWSPLLAYLELFLQEEAKGGGSLRAFLVWLYKTNCIVFHALQSAWIPLEDRDAELTQRFQAVARKFPKLRPLQEVGVALQSLRYFWTNPQTYAFTAATRKLSSRGSV